MYKNTVTLDFAAIVKPLIIMFGLSEAAVDMSFKVPASAAQDPVKNALQLPGDKPKSLMHHGAEFTHEQLLPGPRYAALENAVVRSLQANLSMKNTHAQFYVQSRSDAYTSVSLCNWTLFVLSSAIPDALFGPKLARGNIPLLNAFDSFSKYNWKLWYGWKDANDVRKYKDAFVSEIDKFLDLPLSEREADESWLWQRMETAYIAAGMSRIDITQRAGLLFWVSNSNPSRLSFWILNFLLFRPDLFDRVKEELHAAMPSPDSQLDTDKLANESPLLNAVIEETLRIVIEGASVRIVTDPKGLQIGGKVIPHGARLFAPPRQLHMNEKVWPDAKSFHPERWLAKDVPGKKDHYKPWGGGVTFCPGRFLAKSTIRCFLAIAVARYDISLGPWQVEAKFKLDEPVNGPVYPIEGMDLKLRLRVKH